MYTDMVEGIIDLDKRARERIAFYIDLVMFIVVAASVVSLAIHSYISGMYAVQGSSINATNEMMYVAASVAFLAVSMTWIFIRYFKNLSRR
ncbi:MAG TPA: hypothetical protein ENI49_07280 [Thermoplasmatales archaeon]|nr:hypothetical protein [Thermoplasmatales archaeon]